MKKIVDFIIHNAAEIAARITTKSPTLFKNLQKIFGFLAGLVGLALFLIDQGIWAPSFAGMIQQYGGTFLAVSAAIFGTSALPVKDTAAKDEKKEDIKTALVGDRPPPRKNSGIEEDQ